MKRKTCWIFLSFLFILIVGCNDTKSYRIGVSQCSDDDWRQKMNAEILREMMFYPEAVVEIRSANDDNAKQIEDIRYFIDNKFDVIIAAPNEADALTPIITEAYQGGIPIVLFDRNIHGDSYTSWQGADNIAIGKAAAEHAIAKAGEGASVIEIRGLKGSTPAEERHEGFNSVKGVNVIGDGFGNWNAEDAWVVADSLLTLYPEVKVIYAHNDRMAIAARKVARSMGLTPYIIGIDAAPEIGMKAVADSLIDATFLYPTEGQRLVATAMAILTGQPYDTITDLPASAAVEASNVDILLLQNEAVKQETEKMELLKKEMDDYWEKHTSQTAMLYAVITIVLLLSGLLFLLLRTFWQHRRHQAQLDAATASKLAFFTNVSHDLRTPLTLISEPVEQLSNADNITERQRSLMKIADKNVRILKRLINQILDFRKFENHKLELALAEIDFGELAQGWTEAFEGLAARRNIKYVVDIHPGDYKLAVDIEKMERVFYNLVSNAFKYTPEGGSITVETSVNAKSLIIKVTDTGKGISAEDMPLIFDRFFQSDKVRPNGSGIGLALAKAFVELHGGKITAKSTLGKGSEFTVVLPVVHVKNVGHVNVERMITAETVDAEHRDMVVSGTVPVVSDNLDVPTLLVIDDNPDIRALLAELLSETYTIITACDGAEGLSLAEKYVPDLVISDVMMPEMDGIEFCRRLKKHVATSHIPVLLLTACAMDEQRVEGYDVGADGYLSKPFSASVLKARIRSLITNRKLIRNLWQKGSADIEKTTGQPSKPTVAGAPDIDNEFYKKFLALVDENMGDPDLNVEDLASSMNLGRSQFYRKIKSLTNYSPVELLRRLRLARAQELLLSTEKTVSEISFEVGFSTPAYFTKCYREIYSETPTDTRDKRITKV